MCQLVALLLRLTDNVFDLYGTESTPPESYATGFITCYKTRVGNEMIYLSLSGLGSNYEAEEVEYMICAVAKPLVSEGLFATPHFLTLLSCRLRPHPLCVLPCNILRAIPEKISLFA